MGNLLSEVHHWVHCESKDHVHVKLSDGLGQLSSTNHKPSSHEIFATAPQGATNLETTCLP